MFGDLGHGLIVTLFASYLCIWEKKLTKVKAGEVSTTLSPLLAASQTS